MSGEALKYEGALLEPASAESLLRLKNRIKELAQLGNLPDENGDYFATWRFLKTDGFIDFDVFYSSKLTECEDCKETFLVTANRIADLKSLGMSDKESAYSYSILVTKIEDGPDPEEVALIERDTKLLGKFVDNPKFIGLSNEIFDILMYGATSIGIKIKDLQDSQSLEAVLDSRRSKANEGLVLNLLTQLQAAIPLRKDS